MSNGTGLSSRSSMPVWRSFVCTLPIACALVPVAMLCGILAAQSDWRLMEVALFSALGFSGSGQLALLPLAAQGLGVFTMLLMTVSINSRYIPMALSAAARLPRTGLLRALIAHMLGDEAFAVESAQGAAASVVTIRLTIYVTWVLSNIAGFLLFFLIPHQWLNTGINLGFPASIVLLVLSLGQLKSRLPTIGADRKERAKEVAVCVLVALVLFALIGKIWFWLPSIAFCTWRMRRIDI